MSTAARGLGRSARAFASISHARLASRSAAFSAFPGQSMYVRQMASVSAAVNSRASGMLAALAGAGTLATAIATLQTAECDASAVPAITPESGLPDGLKPVEKLSDFDVVLYQYQPCPFCNKVRAFLDYHKIPYKTVEVNPLFKGELKFTDYKKVPLAVVQGVQVKDSAHIINVLSAMLPPSTSAAPTAPTPAKASSSWWPFSSSTTAPAPTVAPASSSTASKTARDPQKWCKWADDVFVHLLPANIYRTPSEALHSFDYLLEHGNFPAVQRDLARYVGAAAMHLLSKYKLNKKYNITQPREQLYAAVNEWVDAVADTSFHGGAKPDMADLTIFGLLRSIESYDVFADVMANTRVRDWFARMTAAVGSSSRVE